MVLFHRYVNRNIPRHTTNQLLGAGFPIKDGIYGYILCWRKKQKFKDEKTKISSLKLFMQNVDLEIHSLNS